MARGAEVLVVPLDQVLYRVMPVPYVGAPERKRTVIEYHARKMLTHDPMDKFLFSAVRLGGDDIDEHYLVGLVRVSAIESMVRWKQEAVDPLGSMVLRMVEDCGQRSWMLLVEAGGAWFGVCAMEGGRFYSASFSKAESEDSASGEVDTVGKGAARFLGAVQRELGDLPNGRWRVAGSVAALDSLRDTLIENDRWGLVDVDYEEWVLQKDDPIEARLLGDGEWICPGKLLTFAKLDLEPEAMRGAVGLAWWASRTLVIWVILLVLASGGFAYWGSTLMRSGAAIELTLMSTMENGTILVPKQVELAMGTAKSWENGALISAFWPELFVHIERSLASVGNVWLEDFELTLDRPERSGASLRQDKRSVECARVYMTGQLLVRSRGEVAGDMEEAKAKLDMLRDTLLSWRGVSGVVAFEVDFRGLDADRERVGFSIVLALAGNDNPLGGA